MNIKKSLLPNFLCIGAQRAGTTWLYHNLKQHPEIFLPDVKELRFFNYNYDNGLEKYQSYFTEIADEKAYGEITPDYYRQPEALKRIAKDLPDVKLIFIMRNPIERAFSHYELLRGSGVTKQSFKTAYLEKQKLIDYGKYGQHIKFILDNFNRENLLILDYDLLVNNSQLFLKQIFTFLNVNVDFIPLQMEKRYNKILYPNLQKLFMKMNMGWLLNLTKNSFIGDYIRKTNEKNNFKYRNEDVRLLCKSYQEDIKYLSILLNKDYNFWLDKYK